MPTYLALSETRDHVRTAVALYESARQQQIVFLDEDGEADRVESA
jgi:hypothetical protein